MVGAWGYPPTHTRSASRQGSERASGWWGQGAPRRRVGVQSPIRRESPERAEPSLVGAWGYPPNPYPLRFPPGKRAGLRRWDRAHPDAESRNLYEYGTGAKDLVERGAIVTQVRPVRICGRKMPHHERGYPPFVLSLSKDNLEVTRVLQVGSLVARRKAQPWR